MSLTLVSSASGYDHAPLRVGNLKPDSWAMPTTAAQRALIGTMFFGVKVVSAYCTGVIMIGYESVSSTVIGTVRYWDKLYCGVRLANGAGYQAIFDQKGKGASAYTVYRVERA